MRAGTPKPDGDLASAPAWLSVTQKAVWRYALSNAPLGLLKRLDRSVLVTWVVACDLHRQATEKLQTEGLTTTTPNGMEVQSPYAAIVNRQALVMLRAASELGFTPAARSRVSVPDGDRNKDKPKGADRFFG